MKMNRATAVLLGATIAFLSSVQAAEYFVNRQGADANNGTSRETAFLTIQKGVDALKAGDTLTIGSGEYFENVARANLGGPNADTVIRAEIPGTAVLRGDVAAPALEKVEGYRFVYGAAFDQTPLAVFEHDTLSTLSKRPTLRDVEYEPGTFYYDEAEKRLYMSSSDLRAPGGRRYTVSVNGNEGIALAGPQRISIEGLTASGFYPGWGIVLREPVSCTVRDCIACFNTGGIVLQPTGYIGGDACGRGNVVENCVCYGNNFSGISRYVANNDVIRNCRTYMNVHAEGGEYFGIMHYFGMKGPLLIKNNISWGQSFDYSVKPRGQERLENCVGLGHIRNATMVHNLMGGTNEYDPGLSATPADNILFPREENLDKDFEFADPLNLDFRLQSDSRFRGTAPDGTDRGPCQYEPNIFYISPGGDDAADGLSMRKPWRTLARAFEGRRPGDTLYLAEGHYEAAPLNGAGDAESPIAIRGRGYGAVVVTGMLNVTGGAGIVFERLDFSRGAALSDCRDLSFKNCTFFGSADGLKADGVDGLTVTHSVFMGVPLRATNSDGLMLTGNIHANLGKPAVVLDAFDGVRYSDYNSYQDAAKTWEVAGAEMSMADLQKRHDRYSRTAAPKFVLEKGVPRIENAEAFEGRGRASTALGIYRDYDAVPKPLELVGPFLHSVSDTTANIEWWVSKPATFDLAWGDTPEMTNKVPNLKAPDCFATYSLTGLKPGTTYYFRILSADTAGRGEAAFAAALEPEMERLSFTTLAVAPKPAVYYVAPDGDDADTGLSRDKAWRTVGRAADAANPGDTVMIAGGTYKEDVRIRATGDEGKSITFRCLPGEKVVFEGKNLTQAFKIAAKKHLRFDGFYFANFGNSMDAVFILWRADDVQITRCLNVEGTGNVGLLVAEYSADLLVRNCVTANGFGMIRLRLCPDWRIENNLFLRPWISVMDYVNTPEQNGIFTKNIVTDNLSYKTHAALFAVARFESFAEKDNCYFFRVPEAERKPFMFYGTAAYGRYAEYGVTTDFKEPPVIVDNPDGTENNPQMTLKEYQAMVGDTGSYAGDPRFAGVANMTGGRGGAMFEALLGRRDLDFPDTFATDPKAVEKGIGLQPEAFKDFWFNKNK